MSDPTKNRHALQFKGDVKSFSSQDILSRLEEAQRQAATLSGARTAPPDPPPPGAGGPADASPSKPLPKAKGVPVAMPKLSDRPENFHALQFKGDVKKFSSTDVGACRPGVARGRGGVACLD